MYNKIVIMLLIVLLLSISSVIGFQSFAEGNEEEVIDTTIEVIETVSLANNDTIMIESLEMTLVSENQHLELYVNHMTASFAIVDKKSDQIWFSNPIDRENDTIVSGENKGLLNSQLILSYYNSNGKITRMDSYKDSVLKEQFEIEGINNGFKVTYSFGEAASGLDRIPQRISGERFQTLILDKIEDDRMRVDLERRFKYIEEEEVWERRDASFPVLIMERTIHLLEEIGYTEEDLAIDNADVGGQDAVVEHPYFIVPLVVEIDERELLVSIDTKEVEYNEAFPISTLQVLPFFGAANESKEGYMLVPDGSGALIHLNNEKSNYQPFNAQVYGNDKAVFSREETVVSETIRLPIFGMKQADHAFFAIIEKGDAVASIHADVAGRLNGYNSIHSSFLFKEVGEITLSGGERSSTISIFQKGKFEKDIVIRYGFLQGEDASYSGMAAYYRNYLQEKHDLVPLEPEENIPFYLDLVGSIWKRKTFLGVPYKSLEPITTFEQAQMIIEELQDANI
ncbi:MAG: DUF5696 domain-containing protein, partial [Bacillaceae bacterium]|nr:DUF5696 domain-containing protein [Bacillaceae bacterium]